MITAVDSSYRNSCRIEHHSRPDPRPIAKQQEEREGCGKDSRYVSAGENARANSRIPNDRQIYVANNARRGLETFGKHVSWRLGRPERKLSVREKEPENVDQQEIAGTLFPFLPINDCQADRPDKVNKQIGSSSIVGTIDPKASIAFLSPQSRRTKLSQRIHSRSSLIIVPVRREPAHLFVSEYHEREWIAVS